MNDTDTYRVTWAAGTEGGTYTTRNRIEADTLLATLAAGNVAARWVQTRAVYTTEHGPPAGDVVMAVQDNGVSWLEQPAPQRNDDSGVTHVAIGEDGLEEAAGSTPAPAAQRYEGPAAPSRLKCTIGDTSAPPKASVIVDEAHGVDLATCERMFGWALTGKQRDAFESALADDKVVTAAANTIGKDWTSVGVDPAAPEPPRSVYDTYTGGGSTPTPTNPSPETPAGQKDWTDEYAAAERAGCYTITEKFSGYEYTLSAPTLAGLWRMQAERCKDGDERARLHAAADQAEDRE